MLGNVCASFCAVKFSISLLAINAERTETRQEPGDALLVSAESI